MKEVKSKKTDWYKQLQNTIKVESSASATKIIDLASEEGASCWLTFLPLQKWGFVLNQQTFHDDIKLDARTCACGQFYSVICKLLPNLNL